MATAAPRLSVGGLSCVVWEWQRNDGGYSAYQPETSAQIETAYSNNSGNCHVGIYTVDFRRMMQKRNDTGYERNIRRSITYLPASPDIKAYWTWNESGRNFLLYTIEATVDIELAYQRGDSIVNLALCSSKLPYTVNFSTFEQTRHGYGTRRKIQRHTTTTSLQMLLQIKGSGGSSGSLVSALHTTMTGNLSSGFACATSSPTIGCSSSAQMKASPTRRKRSNVKKSTGASYRSVNDDIEIVGSFTKASSSTSDPEIFPHAKKIKTLKPLEDGPCPICMNQLSESSGYDEEDTSLLPVPYAPPINVYKLRKCEHMLHRACLLMYIKSSGSKSGFQCPTCKKVYGIKTGDMPDGAMTVKKGSYSLPGHEDCGTIEVTYNFRAGAHNGRSYRANGFPRVCYLPDSPKGQKVLKLLKVAWSRRLTFTVGTSVTTGAMDTVVWNEIHHKTENTSNCSGHGYPDPSYLDNVLMELAAQGVEADSESDPITISSDSDSDL